MAPERQHAHELLDQLGAHQVDSVVKLLEVMVDESLSDQDRAAILSSRQYFAANPEGGVSFDQMLVDCGLSVEKIVQTNPR